MLGVVKTPLGTEEVDDIEDAAEKVVEGGDDDDGGGVVGVELVSTKYFIIVIRCQPGMPDWGGRLWRMPVQWKGL